MLQYPKIFKRPGILALALALALLGSFLPARAADETAQVMMLKEMFGSEQSDWKSILARHSGLLDQTFFERCEARIRWGIENNHFEDSMRFAIVADLAAMVVHRPDMYRFELAEMFAKNGNLENALDLCENILLSNNSHMPALFMKASIYHDTQRFAEAWQMYEDVVKGNYNTAEAYYRMALIDFSLGNDERGKKELEECLKRDPQHKNGLALNDKVKLIEQNMKVGPGLSSIDPYAEAEKVFQEAEAQAAKGDDATAESLYIKVLTLDRKHKNARKYLGALYYRQAKLEKAAEQLAQVAQLDASDLETWHFLGNTYERIFDTKGTAQALTSAVDAYQKAAALDPSNQMVQSELKRAQSKLSSSSAVAP